MTTKTIHLIIRDNRFIAIYRRKDGFQAIHGRYEQTERGDYEASFYGQYVYKSELEDYELFEPQNIYSKTMTGLKQKIRSTIRTKCNDLIVN